MEKQDDADFTRKKDFLIEHGFKTQDEDFKNGVWNQFSKVFDFIKSYGRRQKVVVLMMPGSYHCLIYIEKDAPQSDTTNLFVGQIGSVHQLRYIFSATYLLDE